MSKNLFDVETFETVHATARWVTVRAVSEGQSFTAGGFDLKDAIKRLNTTIGISRSEYYNELQKDYDSRMGSYRGD